MVEQQDDTHKKVILQFQGATKWPMATNTKTQKAKIEIQIKEWEFSIITQKKNRALLDWTLTFGWTTRWQWQRTANELGFMVDKWRSEIGRESTSLSLSL